MNLLEVYNSRLAFKSSNLRPANHVIPRHLPLSDPFQVLLLRKWAGGLVFGDSPKLAKDDFVEVLLPFGQITTLRENDKIAFSPFEL
jgi:hypothetical protein